MTATRVRRATVFLILAGLAASVAAIGAYLTGSGSAALVVGVESLSGSSSAVLDRVASFLPFGFAFGAGMVSAANPCGFAMLPAFLALFLSGTSEKRESQLSRLQRALLVSITVSAGFILLFAVVGLSISAGARWLAVSFPWLGFATGVLLILAGAWLAAGGTIYARLGERWSTPLANASGQGTRRYFTFGLAYGLASLSCTLPVFLAVLGSTLTLTTLPATIVQLTLYGAGMGLVIALLTLSIALFQNALVNRIRRAVPYIAPLSSALLLLAGSYIVYYWLTVGGLLSALAAKS